MASAPPSCYFRRRTMGRASSPPTWACYEQIQDDYSDSADSDSCSEDDEHYDNAPAHSDDSEEQVQDPVPDVDHGHGAADVDGMDMDVDDTDEPDVGAESPTPTPTVSKDKGKQRAVEPEPEPESAPASPQSRRSHRKQKSRQPRTYTLRPILTIHRSQGFVWNQDLFIPPYIKDRYVASTSPPNSSGFISTSASSTNSALNDYEVEVVEIRVAEGELNHIIP